LDGFTAGYPEDRGEQCLRRRRDVGEHQAAVEERPVVGPRDASHDAGPHEVRARRDRLVPEREPQGAAVAWGEDLVVRNPGAGRAQVENLDGTSIPEDRADRRREDHAGMSPPRVHARVVRERLHRALRGAPLSPALRTT
jgi:hypothetical protein